MKLIIKRAPFEKLLETVNNAIPATTAEAAFKNMLLTVTDTGIKVLGSDGMLSIQGTVNKGDKDDPIVNLDPGAVQIPAKYMLDIVKNLQSEIVTLELVDSNMLYVSDERSQFQLNISAAEDYPDIDLSAESNEVIDMRFSDYNALYSATSFAVDTKGPKELFKGININATGNKLTFVATDSFRLARKYVIIQGDHHVSITVPSKTMAVVDHLEGVDNMSLIVDSTKVIFKIGNFLIASKLYNGEFPNVDRIVPTDTNYLLTVNA